MIDVNGWQPRKGLALIVGTWVEAIERIRPMAGSKFVQVEVVATGRHVLVEKAEFRPNDEKRGGE